MGETDKKCNDLSGRILSYEPVEETDTILEFRRRVEEQIDVLRIAIENKKVNDPKKAQNFANKAEVFLSNIIFARNSYLTKTVRILKRDLKKIVAIKKAALKILYDWIVLKREKKREFSKRYVPFEENKNRVNFKSEMMSFYSDDIYYLNGIIFSYSAELSQIEELLRFLKAKDVLGEIGFKTSWKVKTLKDELEAFSQNESSTWSALIKRVLQLQYFKYNDFLKMTIKELIEFLNIRVEVLKYLSNWLNTELNGVVAKKNKLNKTNIEHSENDLKKVLDAYDSFINLYTERKRRVDTEYNLYRFGQGLLKKDIFESLYK